MIAKNISTHPTINANDKKKIKLDKFKKLSANRFLRNAGWLGLAELVNRVFRLGTTVTLARMFSQEDYGMMAIVYTIFEFANVLTLKQGLGAKIIQVRKEELEDICNTSYWLNWILCITIIILQCSLAFPISHAYHSPQLVLPLCLLSSMYLFYPMFMVQAALIERENRLEIRALGYAIQSLVSNTITIVLALLGFGVWSIVVAMVLSTIVWIIVTWKYNSWRPPNSISFKKFKVVMNFGRNILGVELLNKLGDQIDYLIVGKVLGIHALGIYFFAFNAGSGITMNVVNALISALYPHLCAARETLEGLKHEYFSSLKKVAKFLIPLVLLQSVLAPFYVPIIFGEKWSEGIPILILICLSVIPRAYKLSSTILLNSVDKTHISLKLDLIYTSIFVMALWIVAPYGILWVAVTVLSFHTIMSSLFNGLAIKMVFVKESV